MQNADRKRLIAGWTITSLYALAFAAFEAIDCYVSESDATRYTNREWMFQIWLGGVLVVVTVLWSIPALLIVRDRKRLLALSLSLIGVGLTPGIVRLLWWPMSRILTGHSYR